MEVKEKEENKNEIKKEKDKIMPKFILGKKIGLTHIFDQEGNFIPVTVIEAGPCLVTQIKSKDKDGYYAIQLAFGEKKKVNKPQRGHLKKFLKNKEEIKKFARYLKEFKINEKEMEKISIKEGDYIKVNVLKEGELVDVVGFTKGRGFQGVIKRHRFQRGPTSHGSDHHREPGSIGSMFPQRVVKGRKLPGRMGVRRVTVKNLKVVKIEPEKNIICLSGPVPGPKNNLVLIRNNRI